ncbi:MAG: glycerophosphodiester phosphodiesterase family protein [Flavobacteriales bacterium]
MERQEIFVQGHRGYRGKYPENSLIACEKAIVLGVDAIEIDVVVSKDNFLIVSHEPYMCHTLCLKPDGSSISQNEEAALNLYKMSAAEISKYSFGTLPYAKFPDQEKIKSHKLTLLEFCASLEKKLGDDLFPQLTIELKSSSEKNDWFPTAKIYAKLVLEQISKLNEEWPIALQSFDMELLKELDKQGCELPLIVLNEKNDFTIDDICEKLEFIPDGYGALCTIIDEELVEDCITLGVELSAWTVNSKEEIEKLYKLGVRNFISDFPDLF